MPVPFPGAPDELPALLDAFERQPAELESLIVDLSPDQLCARPIANTWTPLELLAHLADSETVYADRVKRIIATDKPLLLGYDESAYVTTLRYHQRDPEIELGIIRLARRQLGPVLRGLPPHAWARTGVHSRRGLFTLKELVQTWVGHVSHHMEFLSRKRIALGI